MKVSLEWLNTYLERDLEPKEVEEALTLIGFEVEGIETVGLPRLENVVVGEILERQQHPDADRLGVCRVRVSADGDPLQIVCGATNYQVGDKVPAALIGAVLPGNFKIKKSKLRGVESHGMLCSGKEIGAGEDHEGLLILPRESRVGAPINELFPAPVTVFDIEITPNRPDCLSYIGLARDLAAWFRTGLKEWKGKAPHREFEPISGQSLVQRFSVEEADGCPFYMAYSIRGVRVGPSPAWMQNRLKAVGVRPINNVVDVTNYVLLELGQPMHAFDAAKVSEGLLEVRRAREGEVARTLDGKDRELRAEDLVIADAAGPMAIAGVMGTERVEVDDETVDLILEVAYFEPKGIRRTSRRMALSSDSSYRFERGVDPQGLARAAARAIELILETAGGEVIENPLVFGGPPDEEEVVRLAPDYIRGRLGFGPNDAEMQRILESLELEVSAGSADGEWEVRIPSFRLDLRRPVDLVEEVLRIYGSDRIPEAAVKLAGYHGDDSKETRLLRKVSGLMGGRGFLETYHYTLRAEEEVARWVGEAESRRFRLANPLASDQSHLRASLIPGLIDAVAHNLARVEDDQRFFESGKVFREVNGEILECTAVAFVIFDSSKVKRWKAKVPADYYAVRSGLEALLRLAGIQLEADAFSYPTREGDVWMERRAGATGSLSADGWQVEGGMLAPELVKAWNLTEPILAGEWIFTPEWVRSLESTVRFLPVSGYPSSEKDLALLVAKERLSGEINRLVQQAAVETAGEGVLVEAVECFDVYEGEGLPEGQKSLAFGIRYRAPDRTLSEKEISTAFEGLQRRLGEVDQITVRSR